MATQAVLLAETLQLAIDGVPARAAFAVVARHFGVDTATGVALSVRAASPATRFAISALRLFVSVVSAADRFVISLFRLVVSVLSAAILAEVSVATVLSV